MFADPFIVRESRFVSETSAGERSHAAEPPKCTDTRRNSPRTFLPSLSPPPSPPLPPASLPWTRLVHFDSIVRRADAAPCSTTTVRFAPACVLSAPRCRTERFRRESAARESAARAPKSTLRILSPSRSRERAHVRRTSARVKSPSPSPRPCSFPHVVANFPSTQRSSVFRFRSAIILHQERTPFVTVPRPWSLPSTEGRFRASFRARLT